MQRRTTALARYVLVPAVLYATVLVTVVRLRPGVIGTAPFRAGNFLAGLGFLWVLFNNRSTIAGDS